MPRTKKAQLETAMPNSPVTGERISLSRALSKVPEFQSFSAWLIGSTPLITHAWSFKAKAEMLSKQVGAVKPGRAKKDPEQDFIDSLYDMGVDEFGRRAYGFPAMGIKSCIMSGAHKDKGVARTAVMAGLWLDADMVRVRPALDGAICDMPLVRVFADPPEMREDMVKVGVGLQKTAALAYRGQFRIWAMKITGKYNAAGLNADQLSFLISEAGTGFGLGEWRNERKGLFGSFRLALPDEENEWEDYAANRGPRPTPFEYAEPAYRIAAE